MNEFYNIYTFIIHGIFSSFFVFFGVLSNLLLIVVFLSVRKFRTKLIIRYFLLLLCLDILLLVSGWMINHWKIIATMEKNPDFLINGRRATVEMKKFGGSKNEQIWWF